MNIYEEFLRLENSQEVHRYELTVLGYIFMIFFENKEMELLIYFLKER